VAKCRYCDFNSYQGDGWDSAGYVDALLTEARRRAPASPPTIFIGGGTPTYLPVESLASMMRELRELGAFADPRVEVTVEANPESATLEKLHCLREGGANRLSLGVQSFRARYLQQFDRVHGPEHVFRAVEAARKVGFARVNLDLIFAKPGESAAEWMEDLEGALALEPEHLSCYELTFEEGTALTKDRARGRVEGQDQDSCAAMYHATIARLESRGFAPYEVSAFAKPNEECRHNLVYWTGGDWIGVGAGAGSSIGNTKFLNIKNPSAYAAAARAGDAADPATREEADARTRLAEVLMMGLRLTGGIEVDVVRSRCGLDPLETHAAAIDSLRRDGLLAIDGGWLVATERGRDLGNIVAARFLPDC
jgi:oxygen-independent coproporphyrinogen-3 oxidase